MEPIMIYYLGLLHQRENNTIKLVPATNLQDLSVYVYSTYSFIKSIFECIFLGIKLYNKHVLIFPGDKTKAIFSPSGNYNGNTASFRNTFHVKWNLKT